MSLTVPHCSSLTLSRSLVFSDTAAAACRRSSVGFPQTPLPSAPRILSAKARSLTNWYAQNADCERMNNTAAHTLLDSSVDCATRVTLQGARQSKRNKNCGGLGKNVTLPEHNEIQINLSSRGECADVCLKLNIYSEGKRTGINVAISLQKCTLDWTWMTIFNSWIVKKPTKQTKKNIKIFLKTRWNGWF